MFSLWNVSQKPKKNQLMRPSPKRKNNSFFDGFIKGASRLIFWRKCVGAGMTVEAAMVLPLFLFFFVNLGSGLEMIRLHGNMQLALWEVGNRMCVYGHIREAAGTKNQEGEAADAEAKGGFWDDMGEIALTYTYVKDCVVEYVGEEYLETSPVAKGKSGLQFWESEIGDVLDIVMTYQVAPPMELPYVASFRMYNRYYGRLWTGYDVNNGEDVVYVAENASVYHESPECTHLKLTISQVSLEEAKKAGNENGEAYEACERCWEDETVGVVYIAREGEHYHKDRFCPGLKRTVITLWRSEAERKYKACSRCGAGWEEED